MLLNSSPSPTSAPTMEPPVKPQSNKTSLWFPIESFNRAINGDSSNSCLALAKKVLNLAYLIIIPLNLLLIPFILAYNFCSSDKTPLDRVVEEITTTTTETETETTTETEETSTSEPDATDATHEEAVSPSPINTDLPPAEPAAPKSPKVMDKLRAFAQKVKEAYRKRFLPKPTAEIQAAPLAPVVAVKNGTFLPAPGSAQVEIDPLPTDLNVDEQALMKLCDSFEPETAPIPVQRSLTAEEQFLLDQIALIEQGQKPEIPGTPYKTMKVESELEPESPTT